MRVTIVTVLLSAFAGFSAAQNVLPPSTVDVKAAAKQIVADVRQLVEQARGGIVLDQLYQGVLAQEGKASDLILLLPQPVRECETTAVIKMAARGTGSHEVLTVMLADLEDTMSVLNGRLALSLAFLEQVVMQMEDELSLSDDVGGHLSAIVFGANTTGNIVETADKTVKQLLAQPNNRRLLNRVRRQSQSAPPSGFAVPNINLGGGWDLGLSGLNWHSSGGSTSFNLKPTFSGIVPNGGQATLNFDRTPWGSPGSTSLNLGGSSNNGGSVNLGIKIKF